MPDSALDMRQAELADEIAGLVAQERDKLARKSAQAAARAVRAAARSAARAVPPQRDATFAHLSLDGIRAYRQTIGHEAEQVAYWQRVVNTRLDAVRGQGGDVDVAHLRPALIADRVRSARLLIGEVTGTPLPELDSLDQIWVEPTGPAAETTLSAVAGQLERYHRELSARSRAATFELIARYRQTPHDCLSALPI